MARFLDDWRLKAVHWMTLHRAATVRSQEARLWKNSPSPWYGFGLFMGTHEDEYRKVKRSRKDCRSSYGVHSGWRVSIVVRYSSGQMCRRLSLSFRAQISQIKAVRQSCPSKPLSLLIKVLLACRVGALFAIRRVVVFRIAFTPNDTVIAFAFIVSSLWVTNAFVAQGRSFVSLTLHTYSPIPYTLLKQRKQEWVSTLSVATAADAWRPSPKE